MWPPPPGLRSYSNPVCKLRSLLILDTLVRPWIDPPLNACGRRLAAMGVVADGMTIVGLGVGLGAAAAIATQRFGLGLLLLALSRLFDGLDGAVARSSAPTDRGAYLDIVCDFVLYAAIPLAFAFANPARNALPAAALLASFAVTGTSFLAFATLAAKRGLETTAQGRKTFFYSFGVMEGTETIAFLAAMTVWPQGFPTLAWIAAGLCVLTVVQRTVLAIRTFR
jgi:phosphatidylglycerophosphate synthase